MKTFVAISLFIFWSVVTAMLVAGLIFYRENKAGSDSLGSSAAPGIPAGSNSAEMTLDAQEISNHNSANDCWLLIDGRIYNVTRFLGEHPGGAYSITPYCGKEASQAFATEGIGKPHSNYARDLLAAYYIGYLNQKINAQGSMQPSNQSNDASPAPVSSPQSPPATTATLTLDMQEVSRHNSSGDCWMVVGNRIYNVTNYIGTHPGGAGAIAGYCGKDGTQAFAGLPHSSNANSILAGYYIGEFNQNVTAQQLQQNVQNISQTPPPKGKNNKDDYDEEEDDD